MVFLSFDIHKQNMLLGHVYYHHQWKERSNDISHGREWRRTERHGLEKDFQTNR